MSRSYSTFKDKQPFSDGWKKPTYSAMAPSDNVHHPVFMDAQGMGMPIIHHASGSNGEAYGIIAEKIVEQNIVPAPVSRFLVAEYRRSSEQPGKEELFRDYGIESRSTHRGSTYDRPEKVEAYDLPEKAAEFNTKVVTEAGRGPPRPVAVPLSSAWRPLPKQIVQEKTRKYGDERDLREDDLKKLNANPNWDRHGEPYPNKPSYGIGKEKQLNASAYTEASPPIKTVPLVSTAGWRTSSNLPGPETKMESKDYNSEEEEEESRHPRLGKRDELDMANSRGGVKSFENKDGNEEPKGSAAAVQFGQARFPGSPLMQKEEKNTYPEKLDSREAGAYTEAREPIKTIPQVPTAGWRTGSNMPGPETKMESKDYNSKEGEEESGHPRLGKRDELEMANSRGGVKSFENKDGNEKPKGSAATVQFGQARFPGSPLMQKEEKNTYPEKLDSREAGAYTEARGPTKPVPLVYTAERRTGSNMSYEKPIGNATALQFGHTGFPVSTLMQKKVPNSYPEIIDSNTAMVKYNGTLIR